MAVVGWVLRAELRYRWRSWALLALLVAVVGGVVLGAAGAARRTAAAFPSFYRSYGYDSYAYGIGPVPGLARLPEVRSVVTLNAFVNGVPRCACRHSLNSTEFSVYAISPRQLQHFAKLVSGHLPSQSSEHDVLASFNLQQDEGLHVGSVFHVPLYGSSQPPQTENPPRGPKVALRVVGFVADEEDFPSVGTPAYELFTTRAFDERVGPQAAVQTSYVVRLRHGSADVARFDKDSSALGVLGQGGQEATATISSSIHPQAVGWWILAGLAALAALATVGQALARQAAVQSENDRIMAAVGMGPPTLTALSMARVLIVAVAGAVGAVVLAFVLSPLSPVGEARIAEPSNGWSFDPIVLGLGGCAVVVAVLLLGLWPSLRYSRLSGFRSSAATIGPASQLVSRIAAAGAPPTVTVGTSRALERGRGSDALPVGTALLGAILAVTALCGTVVFGASLRHVTSTPALYGQPFQLWFDNLGSGPGTPSPQALISQLERDRAVTAVTLGTSGSVVVNGVSTVVIAGQAERGRMLVSPLAGRLPSGADDIALGSKTLRQVGAHVGSLVAVSVPTVRGGVAPRQTFRVVGTASFPPDFGVVGLSTGAIFTIDGYVHAQCPSASAPPGCQDAVRKSLYYVVLAGLRPGPAGNASTAHFLAAYPNSALEPSTPANLVNFGEAVNFPLVLGIVLAIFGAATLAHVLAVSVTRRRREVGQLKVLGFLRRQVAAATGWQAVTVATVGLVVGAPLGVALGQLVWRAFATNIGVVPVAIVSGWAITVLCALVVAGALALAVLPALASAAVEPAALLRSE